MKKRGKKQVKNPKKTRKTRKVEKKEVKKTNILYIPLRYLILLVAGIFISVFYKVFFPLTIWPVYIILQIFYDVILSGTILTVSGYNIEIVNACVAGSAYYLLLILNLTIPMNARKRIYSILFSFISLLILNILRIALLSVLYVQDFAYFDFTHKLFWYTLSIVFVVAIWFATVKVYKIKEAPVYSDIKQLYK